MEQIMTMSGNTSTWTALALGAVMLVAGLHAQAPSDQHYNSPLSSEEESAIEAGRKNAKPRLIVPRKPLNSIEAARVAIFKRSKPSVVHLFAATSGKLPDLWTGTYFGIPPGTGTGFVWDDKGHVVTNYHVVLVKSGGAPFTEAEDLRVTLANGRTYRARLIAKSLAFDVAVLRVFAPLKDMKPLPLGSAKDLQVGQSVLAIGNPFGWDHTLTQGIISGLGREVLLDPELQGTIRDAIQTDAAINPGNSGGPLLDSSGRLIGMNTSIESKTGGSAGVNFAIPVDTLNRVVPLLIAKGRIDRVELGFTAISSRWAEACGVTQGAVVGAVKPGSIADRSGLRGWHIKEGDIEPTLGDIIVGFQGRLVENEVHLFDLMGLEPPHAVLQFDVLRAGVRVRITMRPGDIKPGTAPQL